MRVPTSVPTTQNRPEHRLEQIGRNRLLFATIFKKVGTREVGTRWLEQALRGLVGVRRELAGMGIDPSRVEAEGYGDQHPIADNMTEQGRAKNRRISVQVLQK